MIVEDDQIMRQFYSILFQRNGFDIFISENGVDIIQHLNNECFDLIIIDINLNNTYLNGEQINGLVLLGVIRQIESVKKTPVVLVTANSFPLTDNIAFSEDSIELIITKPIVNYTEFINKINEIILDW